MANCNESAEPATTGGCGSGSDNQVLLDILDQDRAIQVRWTQVFTMGGIPANPIGPAVTLPENSSCRDARIDILEAILEQRAGIYNAMFFG